MAMVIVMRTGDCSGIKYLSVYGAEPVLADLVTESGFAIGTLRLDPSFNKYVLPLLLVDHLSPPGKGLTKGTEK